MAATSDLVAERHDVRPLRSLLLPVKRCLFAVVCHVMPVRRDQCTVRRRACGHGSRSPTHAKPSVRGGRPCSRGAADRDGRAVRRRHGARRSARESEDFADLPQPGVLARACLLTARRSDLAEGSCDLAISTLDLRRDVTMSRRGSAISRRDTTIRCDAFAFWVERFGMRGRRK